MTATDNSNNSNNSNDDQALTESALSTGQCRARRRALAHLMGPGSVFITASAGPHLLHHSGRTARDADHKPNRDLLWLTGLTAPDCVLIIRTPPGDQAWGGAEGGGGEPDRVSSPPKECHVFIAPADPGRETWSGKMTGIDGALRQCGPDTNVHPLISLKDRLVQILSGCSRLIYWPGAIPGLDSMVAEAGEVARSRWRVGLQGPTTIEHPQNFTGKLRGLKSRAEIRAIQEAVDLTCLAVKQALREQARPGHTENMIKGVVQGVFTGADGAEAFPSIVATGANSTILHYESPGTAALGAGDLLLMDVGARLRGYCGDVTRTFPVGGKFSTPQRDLYDLVLAAQKAAIKEVRPGVSLQEIHQAAVRTLTEGMVRLGILRGEPEGCVTDGSYRYFYPHHTSHFLGLDVHDTTPVLGPREFTRLEPGMVITVEPGIYVSPRAAQSVLPPPPARYLNLGIRIEHDVLVTKTGCRILSNQLPVEREEVEEMAARAMEYRKATHHLM